MKVVILCGGKGTRIRDVSGDLPKPMVRVGDRPILQHVMEIYSRWGHEEFVLCLGYGGWAIKEYFLNFAASTHDLRVNLAGTRQPQIDYFDNGDVPPWHITLAETGLESQTAYRIRQVRRYIGDETFLLTYGDGVGDINIDALLARHRALGTLSTVTAVRPPARFGALGITEQGLVDHFAEKPQSEGGLINGGFFVCEPGVFDYLPDDQSVSLESEPLEHLAKDGELGAYIHEDFWMPMDTSRDYHALNRLWSEGRPPWVRPDR